MALEDLRQLLKATEEWFLAQAKKNTYSAPDAYDRLTAVSQHARDETGDLATYGSVSPDTLQTLLREATAGRIPNDDWRKLTRLVEVAIEKRAEVHSSLDTPTALPKAVQNRASLLFQGKVQEVDKRIEAARLALRREHVSNHPGATFDRIREYAEDSDQRTVALLAAWLDSVVEALNFYKKRLKPYSEVVSRELGQIAASASVSTRAELERRSHVVGGYSGLRALSERSRIRAAQAHADADRRLRLLEEEGPDGAIRSWRDQNPSEFSEFSELSTKRAFDAHLPIAAAESSAAKPLSMVFVDVDDLKALNTKFTNPQVNKGLKELARVLAEVVSGRGKAYRYGGDEFTLLLPNSTQEEAATTAGRVCEAVRALLILEEPQMRLTVSCGVASLEAVSPRSADELEKAAAAAARMAKEQGKDRFVVSPSSSKSAQLGGTTEPGTIKQIQRDVQELHEGPTAGSPRLTDLERQILSASAADGAIQVIEAAQLLYPLLRVGGTALGDIKDSESLAGFWNALMLLSSRGFVERVSENLFRLTADGFACARGLSRGQGIDGPRNPR